MHDLDAKGANFILCSQSLETIAAAQKRLMGTIRIYAVVPDYYARFPKACLGGWGRRQLLIDPSGKALPCHAAAVIPGLHFENVRDRPLEWIWRESESFQNFRGESWMPEPCRSSSPHRRLWRVPVSSLHDHGRCDLD